MTEESLRNIKAICNKKIRPFEPMNISIEQKAKANVRRLVSDREDQTIAIQFVVDEYLKGEHTKAEAWKFTRQPIIVTNDMICHRRGGTLYEINRRAEQVFKREFKER